MAPPHQRKQQQPLKNLPALVRNDAEIDSPYASAKELLAAFPAGCFSTMRTLHQRRVVEFSSHLRRLASSSSAVFGRAVSVEALRERLLPCVGAAVRHFLQPGGSPTAAGAGLQEGEELRLTVLVVKEAAGNPPPLDDLTFFCFATLLPPPPPPPILVEIRHYKRSEQAPAEVKSLEWVKERVALESCMGVGVNEVVMCDANDQLYEGLSSNFFAVHRGALFTAPSPHVLQGTVSAEVERMCQKHSLTLVKEFPKLADHTNWEAAFITSCSRSVLPINTLVFPELPGFPRVNLPPPASSPILTSLLQHIQQEMEEDAQPVV